jgi:hypothetical protein
VILLIIEYDGGRLNAIGSRGEGSIGRFGNISATFSLINRLLLLPMIPYPHFIMKMIQYVTSYFLRITQIV